MKIIGAFDKSSVKELEPRPYSILIRLTSYDSEFDELNGKWYKTLELKFDDVDRRQTEIDGAANVMKDKQAEQILDFVIKNIECDIFVHCDAGLSRSPGVVVALEEIFNARSVSYDYPHYNRYVKNKIKDVWFKRLWFGEED